MPVKKERQLMRRLKQIYVAIFLLALFLLLLFLAREQSVRQLNQQLQTLNYARQDFDAGVLHILLSEQDMNQWQTKIGTELFSQTINGLTALADKHTDSQLHKAIVAIQRELALFLAQPIANKADASQRIFQLRLQMETLHAAFSKVLQQELKTSRYWFFGLVLMAVGLIVGLFLSLIRNEAKRERFHRQLYTTQHQLALIAENIDEVFWLQDAQTDQVLYVSAAFEKMWQLPRQALFDNPDAWIDKVHQDDLQRVKSLLAEDTSVPKQLDYRLVLENGEVKWITDRIFPVSSQNEDGQQKHLIVAVASDITATRKLNEQLMVAQKMDSLGKLTGGIAHDFNNLLTVIMGNAQLLTELTPKDSPLAAVAGLIVKASERGASLNKQLLAFASKQYLKPEQTDVVQLLNEMLQLLRRTLGDNIRIHFSPCAVDVCCFVDAGQLQNAIINLCINAKDAMVQGGDIYLELAVNTSGQFAEISITDTGEGISDDVLPHIFEPFFTTKALQKGSGLGLSMVYGFIRQSGGDIQVSSSPGSGTTFRLMLPICDDTATVVSEMAAAGGVRYKLLLVEDDKMVRDSVVHMLKGSRYQLTTAENGDQGLQLLQSEADFDIMISDVVMPGKLNGIELADKASAEFPKLGILLVSGYVGSLSEKSASFASYAFLPKPFSKSQLLKALLQFSAKSA